jgi:hypothetical protein
MPDVVIPEAVLEEFLRSLLVKVTQVREELTAEVVANLEVFRAKTNAGYERKVERLFCAVEEDLERKARAAEEDLERKRRAAEDQIEIKLREAVDEIARLRQAERLRHTVEAEREPES